MADRFNYLALNVHLEIIEQELKLVRKENQELRRDIAELKECVRSTHMPSYGRPSNLVPLPTFSVGAVQRKFGQ